jgi:hypothetical protein
MIRCCPFCIARFLVVLANVGLALAGFLPRAAAAEKPAIRAITGFVRLERAGERTDFDDPMLVNAVLQPLP